MLPAMTWFGHRSPIRWIHRFFSAKRGVRGGAPKAFRVIGHRGAPRLFPENTVASYSAAIELGANAIEADVCVTKDGAVVLWHDNKPSDPISLARGVGAEEFAFTCDWPNVLSAHRKPVYEMTLEEMRSYCGYSKTGLAFSDPRPPIPFEMFEDLLRWASSEPRLAEIFLDVKLRPEDAARGRILLEVIAAHKKRDDLSIAMLLPQRELYAGLSGLELPPGTRLVPDFELPNVLHDARAVGAREVSLGYSMKRTWGDFTRELSELLLAREARKLDRLILWTFNDEKRLRFLVESGVDGVMTDDPALLKKLAS
jgi:glycerophosphoryl diester phosphodiesterase